MGPAVIEQKKYGGLPQLRLAGEPPETVHGINSTGVKQFSKGPGWKQEKSSSGKQGQYKIEYGEDVKYYPGGAGTISEKAFANAMCRKLEKSKNIEQAISEVFPSYLKRHGWAGDKFGPQDANSPTYEADKELFQNAMMKSVAELQANPDYKECVTAAINNSKIAEHLDEDPKEEPCLCLNKDGSVYKDENGKTKEAPKNDKGECITDDPSCAGVTTETETLKCKCTDPVTG